MWSRFIYDQYANIKKRSWVKLPHHGGGGRVHFQQKNVKTASAEVHYQKYIMAAMFPKWN